MPTVAQVVPASTLGTLYNANAQLAQVNQALVALQGGGLLVSISYGNVPSALAISPPAGNAIYAALIAYLTTLQTTLTTQLSSAGVTVGA